MRYASIFLTLGRHQKALHSKKRGYLLRFFKVTIDKNHDISGIDPRSGHESPQHPVEIMRSGGSDDDDGNVGDETRDGDIGDWVGRERHRRGIGTTAYAAVTFHLVAKRTTTTTLFVPRPLIA